MPNAIANNSISLLLDWGWVLESFYSIYIPKAEIEIYKTTQLLVEFWQGKAAEIEFFLKINHSVVCVTGAVNKDNLKGPGGPENAVLNCFLPNFSIVLYHL